MKTVSTHPVICLRPLHYHHGAGRDPSSLLFPKAESPMPKAGDDNLVTSADRRLFSSSLIRSHFFPSHPLSSPRRRRSIFSSPTRRPKTPDSFLFSCLVLQYPQHQGTSNKGSKQSTLSAKHADIAEQRKSLDSLIVKQLNRNGGTHEDNFIHISISEFSSSTP